MQKNIYNTTFKAKLVEDKNKYYLIYPDNTKLEAYLTNSFRNYITTRKVDLSQPYIFKGEYRTKPDKNNNSILTVNKLLGIDDKAVDEVEFSIIGRVYRVYNSQIDKGYGKYNFLLINLYKRNYRHSLKLCYDWELSEVPNMQLDRNSNPVLIDKTCRFKVQRIKSDLVINDLEVL